MSLRVIRRSFALITALAVTSCADLTGLQDMFGGGRLLSISVAEGIVEVGDTVRVTATGKPSGIIGLLAYDRLLDARWSVSDPTIAQIQPLPPPPPEDSSSPTRTLVRGLRIGTTSVIATARGVTGSAKVRVIPVVATIHVRPARDTIALGDTIRVSAAAVDAGGAPVDGLPFDFSVGGGVQLWRSDAASAHIVAVTLGPATISARFRRTAGEAALVVLPRAP